MSLARPVGVFDSGVGGLSVLREIRRELPAENLLYVADSAHAPYGDKTHQQIEARAIAVTEFLLAQQAKAIVVACNTATGAAVQTLRERYDIPIIAMEPAIKPAVAHTKTGVVGVLATSRTLDSGKFASLSERFGINMTLLLQACPGLVEQVEAGQLTSPETRALLIRYIEPLLMQGADTLVLGCTHYPFLSPLIEEIVGPGVTVMNPAPAVARELRRRLAMAGLLNPAFESGSQHFWSSAAAESVEPVVSQLWGEGVDLASFENPVAECATIAPRP